MIIVVFQTHDVAASCQNGGDYNHARDCNGGIATASGSSGTNTPAKAIDGDSSTYWQSSTTTGWLAVQFRAMASVNEVHAHFTTTKYASLSLYLDTSGNRAYETTEKVWSTTSNGVLDVIISLPQVYLALGAKIAVDAKVGSNLPKINEFEAYLLGDSDGDGLTNAQEAATTYFQDMGPSGLPASIPDDGVNVSSNGVSLTQFYRTGVIALANSTVDHARKTDLTAQIGYWNGSAWIDRYVWDPGRRLDQVSVTQPLPNAYVTGTVEVVATVQHPEITSKVEFRVAGVLQATVTTPVGNDYRWSWNTTGLADGPTLVNATQYDTAGGKAWSQITVNAARPPQMTWVSPANGALVSGVVTVQVTASDYEGVEWVDFYVDGLYKSRVYTPNVGPNGYQWSWDTSQYCTNGQHTLKAVATENGPLYLSTELSVSVTTNQALRVCITSPTPDGATVRNTVVILADAATPQGTTITEVDFYIAYSHWSTDTTAPYASNPWDTTATSDGAYALEAIATNSAGNTAQSVITVHVSNGGGGGGGGGGCRTPPCPVGPVGANETMQADSGAVTQPTATLGVLTTEWARGEVDVGTKATVVVDLVNPQTSASASENASRILRPAIPISTFTTYLQWRLVIRDWSIGSVGNMKSFTLRFEATSDPQAMDTDSDGIGDGTEAYTWSTLPVTRDSDLDGLSDGYEIAPHTLTVWTGGVSSILAAVTTNPALADTDGDGLTDGQERGFVTTGQSKVIGEVGLAVGVTDAWTKVFLKNRYTSPVVIAQPPTQKDGATGVVRIQSITDHTFQLRFQEWSAVGGHGGENVTYLVLESGNHVLPDGTVVEAGTKSGVGTTYVAVPFREAFAQNPIVLAQIQTNADTKAAAAKIRSVGAFSFETYLRTNPLGTHATETVGYVAVAPQADPTTLATWTRLAVSVGSAASGTVSFPKAFAVAPMILSWFATENLNADVSLRLGPVTNASFGYVRETSVTPGVEVLHYFGFAGPMNLTARMTTKPTGTGATDTDGDGLSDGAEVNTYGSNPSLKDTDADGVPDNVEVSDRTITIPVNGTAKSFTFKTSPTSDDTDADGVKDPDELAGILDHRIAFYDMETTLADGRLRDWSGNGGHATLSGTTSVTGKVGNARSFASSNYVQAGDAPVLSPGMITVAAWVSISSSAGTYNPVVVKGQSGVDFQYYMDVRKVGTAWKLNAQVKNVAGTTASATSSTSITAATWTHVGFTFDGSTVRLYINGVADTTTASLSGSLRTTGQPLRIGHYYGSTSYFLGSIDEVQLWDRALALEEIAQYSGADLPVVRFDMESLRSDGRLADFAGKGNAGTLFATSVVEGRIGFARNFGPAASSVNVTDAASLNFNTAGLTVSTYVLASSAPASDVSLVAKKGEFYLNLSSDGLVRFTIYTKTPLVSQLPLPLNRWVRVSATTDATTMALYFDDVLMASAAGFKPTDTANPITLARAEGCSPSCPRFGGSLDELVVYAKGIAQTALTKSSARGILLNPNATDTDFDGLSDGQELFVKTAKTPKRYPIQNQTWAFTDNVDLGLGGPAWAIRSMDLMVGWTHPDMGQLQTILDHYRNGLVERQLTLRSYQNAGEANNFTSYDLLNKGVLPSEFTSGGVWYLQSWDKTADSKKGQMEYMQFQITVHTLPNRADTDADGLNDSEELNLGSDGFSTDPWKTDTDGDSLPDNEYFTKGTSPVLADTDRDGVRDDVDRAPLGDAFVEVEIDSAYVSGSDAHSTGNVPLPFVKVTIQGNTTYTPHLDGRSGTWYTTDYVTLNSYVGHRLSVNVPDDVAQVDFTVEMWSYDSRKDGNGNPYNQHTSVIAGSHTEYLGGVPYCVDDTVVTRAYSIQAAGQSTSYSFRGCGSGLYANPLNVTLRTIVPGRVTTDLIVPADYSGVYNITNASGGIVGRRYIGEPRFVAILLNATTYEPAFHCYCGPPVPMSFLVPRSVFFDTELYKRLNASNPTTPLDKLTFRQNDTSASANSDSLQEILTGNVTMGDWVSILFLLEDNATNVPVRTALRLANDLLLYSLPDDVVRFIAYAPPLTAPSWTYTFCTSSCGPPTAKPWWEQVWTGLLIVAAVLSAVILPINAFAALVRLLVQVGNWLWTNIVGPGIAAVASAVQAAAETFGKLVSWVVDLIIAALRTAFQPVINILESWRSGVSLNGLTLAAMMFPGKVGSSALLTGSVGLDLVSLGLSFAEVLLFGAGFVMMMFAVATAFELLEVTVKSFTVGLANLLSKPVVEVIKGIIIAGILASFVAAVFDDVIELIPPNLDVVANGMFSLTEVIAALAIWTHFRMNGMTYFWGAAAGLALSAVAFGLLAIKEIIADQLHNRFGLSENGYVASAVSIIFDAIGVRLSQEAQRRVKMDPVGAYAYELTYKVSDILASLGKLATVGSIVADVSLLGIAVARGEA